MEGGCCIQNLIVHMDNGKLKFLFEKHINTFSLTFYAFRPNAKNTRLAKQIMATISLRDCNTS